jgi:hypothetical protein
MTQTFTGRRRVRKFFGSIREVAEMPNLIEVQKASYDQFLLVEEPDGGRGDEGLQAVFKSVFPISDFSNSALLEFVRYDFDPPKYDVDECRQRGMTFSAPLKVTLRLIVFDIDEETGAKSVKDIKEPRASSRIAAPGSTSSSTPRTSCMRVSTGAARFRSPRSCSRSAWTARRSSTPSTARSSTSA